MEPIFSNLTIVLCKTKYSENIGSAARAMCNMGISNLALVAPANIDLEKVKKTATHESVNVVNTIRIYETLKEAIGDSHYVVGTTARLGRQRREPLSPSDAAQAIIPLLHNNRVAILFGPEDRGLENKDLDYCDILVNIPTMGFTSINLSHAVMLLCYEIAGAVNPSSEKPVQRLADKNELERLFDHLEEVLITTGYTNPENPGFYLSKFRRFLYRLQLKPGEVHIVNGLLQKLLSIVPKK